MQYFAIICKKKKKKKKKPIHQKCNGTLLSLFFSFWIFLPMSYSIQRHDQFDLLIRFKCIHFSIKHKSPTRFVILKFIFKFSVDVSQGRMDEHRRRKAAVLHGERVQKRHLLVVVWEAGAVSTSEKTGRWCLESLLRLCVVLRGMQRLKVARLLLQFQYILHRKRRWCNQARKHHQALLDYIYNVIPESTESFEH